MQKMGTAGSRISEVLLHGMATGSMQHRKIIYSLSNKNMEKTITSDQRKMLSKLYDKQIEEKMKQEREKRNQEQEEFENNIINTEAKSFKDRLKKLNDLEKLVEKTEKELKTELEDTKFYFSGYDPKEISIKSEHSKLKKFNDETKNLYQKMDTAKTKILVDIWGLTGDYNAIVNQINKEFEAIGL